MNSIISLPPLLLKLSLLGAVIFLVFFICSCSPLYIMRATWEQAQILTSRRPLEEAVNDQETPAKVAETLNELMRVREYAERQGLNVGKSYSTYVDMKRDVLVWVVSAAKRDSLEPYTWWFPVVGSLPYKGFYDRESAEAEVRSLNEKGYDTYMRPSSAYSTLG